jgi:LysR family transcriptional regulator, cyn operon transcriptional activator
MILRHIRYLLAVAEQGNFTRAAEVLHVSQPTLSQQIRQLEETLGAVLLDRSGRRVRLTDAGEVWARHAKLALRDLDSGARAIHDVAELSRGSIRFAATPTFTSYLTGSVVSKFHQLYPGISIDLHEITQSQIELMLADDKLDLGIAFGHAQSTEIECETLFSETLNLVVGKQHPLIESVNALSVNLLTREPLVLLNSSFATRRHIDDYCRQLNIKANVVIETNSIGTILEIVRKGNISTILPSPIDLEGADLHSIELNPPLPARSAVLLRRKDAYQTSAMRAFTQVLSGFSA